METRVEANIDVEMVDIETQAEITTATRLEISFCSGSFKSFIRPDFLFHAHEMLF